MAFTGIAAIVGAVGAGTAVTVSMVLVAVAEVGTILSVVGAVTGNETLMKIGGVMGLVGGIGSAISGAASGAASAGLDAAAGEAFTEAGTSLASDLGSNGLGALESTMSPGELLNGATGTVGQTASEALTAPMTGGILNEAATAPGAATPASPNVTGAEGGDQFLGVQTPQGATGPAGAQAPTVVDNTAISTPGGSTGGAQPSGSWYSSIGKAWTGAGDNTKAALIKTGAGLLQGAAQGKNQEEQNAIARAKLQQTAYGSAVPAGVKRT